MGNAHVADQVAHVACAENVPYQAAALVHLEFAAVRGDDAGCVLSPVLQDQQPVIKQLVYRRLRDDAEQR